MFYEYQSLEEFYNQGLFYIQQIKRILPHDTKIKQIEFYRKYYKSKVLNSYIKICLLNKEHKKLLQTNNLVLKFSIDSLIKNMLRHPEITFEEYLFIKSIISKPDKMVLSKNNNNSILVFKFRNNYYQVVIKTTTDKSENYLTSFIRSNEKEYNRY